MPGPNSISTAQLARLIGTPEAPLLLDVRLDEDAEADPFLLPTALPCRAQDVLRHAHGRPVVVICARGAKLSEGAAALLRAEGTPAEVLEGGHEAWRAAALPLVPAALMPQTALWVTRHRPKIDRIACPWLIRRFIDPRAVFLFVSPAEVEGVAERFGAMPYDIEGVFWSHRGDLCTFDVLLSEFGLSTPALERLALIVRGADTAQLDLAPESAGLLAASLGLSRMYSDDLAQLEAGIALYDAFYRWARDATDEQHNWPTNSGKSK